MSEEEVARIAKELTGSAIEISSLNRGPKNQIAAEKIRGRRVDPTKLVPVTAAVAAFFVLFVGSLIYLDFVKPVPNLFR